MTLINYKSKGCNGPEPVVFAFLSFFFISNKHGSQTHGYKSVYFSFRGSSWAARCLSDSVCAGLLGVMLFILQSDESDEYIQFIWVNVNERPDPAVFLPLH